MEAPILRITKPLILPAKGYPLCHGSYEYPQFMATIDVRNRYQCHVCNRFIDRYTHQYSKFRYRFFPHQPTGKECPHNLEGIIRSVMLDLIIERRNERFVDEDTRKLLQAVSQFLNLYDT